MNVLKRAYTQDNNEILLVENHDKQIDNEFDKTILIIGVFHGDEPQGKFLIENYINTQQSGKNRLLFISCLNPDGMANNIRQNANLIDLNRNFPTGNWELNASDNNEFYGGASPSSEIETKFVVETIEEFSPDIILTLHAPYKVVNYDGPAEKIAEKISELINYPVQKDIGYNTPGSFGTYAGVEKNIPTITLELDEEIDVKELIKPVNKIFDYLLNV